MDETTRLPKELEGYRHDMDFEARFQSRQSIGCWVVVSLFVVAIAGTVYFQTWTCALITLAIGVGGFVFGCQSARRHRIACWQCEREMDTVPTAFPKEELKDLDGFGMNHTLLSPLISFEGADGHIYQIQEHSADKHSRRSWGFSRLLQRWYKCDRCEICICAEPRASHSLRMVHNQAEVELLKDRLTGDHKKVIEFLRELEGGGEDEMTFLERLENDAADKTNS